MVFTPGLLLSANENPALQREWCEESRAPLLVLTGCQAPSLINAFITRDRKPAGEAGSALMEKSSLETQRVELSVVMRGDERRCLRGSALRFGARYSSGAGTVLGTVDVQQHPWSVPTTWQQHPHLHTPVNRVFLQILPSVPSGAKVCPVENYCMERNEGMTEGGSGRVQRTAALSAVKEGFKRDPAESRCW